MTLPPRLFCDTSFSYACLAPADRNHGRAAAMAGDAAAAGVVLCTTWDVVSETVTLLRKRSGCRPAIAFLAQIKPRLHIVDHGDGVRDEAERVFHRCAREHRLSSCDAVSFAVVTTLLAHLPCLACDDDSRSLGLTVIG